LTESNDIEDRFANAVKFVLDAFGGASLTPSNKQAPRGGYRRRRRARILLLCIASIAVVAVIVGAASQAWRRHLASIAARGDRDNERPHHRPVNRRTGTWIHRSGSERCEHRRFGVADRRRRPPLATLRRTSSLSSRVRALRPERDGDRACGFCGFLCKRREDRV